MTFVRAHAEVGEFKRRFRWIVLFVLVCFLILSARLLYLQVLRHEEYRELALDNIIRTYEQPAVRGTIRDARGRVMATNRPAHNLYITPADFDLDHLPLIADFLDLNEAATERLRGRLTGFATDDLRRFQPMLAAEDLERDELALIETHLNELGGVHVQSIPVRTYPYGSAAAHLIGYVNEVSPEDLERWSDRDYHPGDVVGRVGIERSFEQDLRGERGWSKVVVNARGIRQPEHVQQAVLGENRAHDAEPGLDLTLTVDVALQQVVQRALRGHPSGAVVVVEVNTGRVLAIVSKPSFDPNDMTGGLSPEQARELLDNPLTPQFNRALMGTYSPGSTFKIITAFAALEEGMVNPSEQLFCGGFHELGRRAFRCSQTHGDVDMRLAIIQSCNVYFYRLAEHSGMMEAITEYAHHFGFGRETGLEIANARGRVDTREAHSEYRLGHALNAAIGQGQTMVTVLQMAMAYAAVANGGTLYHPSILRRVESAEGGVIRELEPRPNHRLRISEAHLALVNEALIGVVHHPSGTAHEQALEDLDAAGKTGTAEVPRQPPPTGNLPRRLGRWFFNRDHGWFAGFAPAYAPQVAIAVLIEHGGTGGRSAAPVAMSVLHSYFQEIAPLHGEPEGDDGDTDDEEEQE